MKTIWKYELKFEEKFQIEMPVKAIVRYVALDEKTNKPCIWVELEPSTTTQEYHFELFGTGHEIHSNMGVERIYLGSYQYQNGEFIGHLYQRIN